MALEFRKIAWLVELLVRRILFRIGDVLVDLRHGASPNLPSDKVRPPLVKLAVLDDRVRLLFQNISVVPEFLAKLVVVPHPGVMAAVVHRPEQVIPASPFSSVHIPKYLYFL